MMHGTYNVKLRDSFFLDSPRIIENHVIKIGPDQKKTSPVIRISIFTLVIEIS